MRSRRASATEPGDLTLRTVVNPAMIVLCVCDAVDCGVFFAFLHSGSHALECGFDFACEVCVAVDELLEDEGAWWEVDDLGVWLIREPGVDADEAIADFGDDAIGDEDRDLVLWLLAGGYDEGLDWAPI